MLPPELEVGFEARGSSPLLQTRDEGGCTSASRSRFVLTRRRGRPTASRRASEWPSAPRAGSRVDQVDRDRSAEVASLPAVGLGDRRVRRGETSGSRASPRRSRANWVRISPLRPTPSVPAPSRAARCGSRTRRRALTPKPTSNRSSRTVRFRFASACSPRPSSPRSSLIGAGNRGYVPASRKSMSARGCRRAREVGHDVVYGHLTVAVAVGQEVHPGRPERLENLSPSPRLAVSCETSSSLLTTRSRISRRKPSLSSGHRR